MRPFLKNDGVFKNWIFAVILVAAISLIAGAVFAKPAHRPRQYALGGAGGVPGFELPLDGTHRYEIRHVAGPDVECGADEGGGESVVARISEGMDGGHTAIAQGGAIWSRIWCHVYPDNKDSLTGTTVVAIYRQDD